MNDAGGVGSLKRSTYFYGNSEYFRDLKRAAGDPFFEGLSFQQLVGDEVQSIRFLDLVNRANVGVIER